MFATKPDQFIRYSEVICGAFKGTDRSYIYDRKDIRDDLLSQLNESMGFIQKQLNVRSEIRGINRHDIYELPLAALREAVVNAIVHRDYSMRGTSVYVAVYDDRVEIENPGGFTAGVTKQNFGKTSIRRNLILADLFHRMGKVERMGSGIRRMKSLMKQAGLKPPVFEADTFFRTTFYREPKYALKAPQSTTQKTTQKATQKILEAIKQNPRTTRKELAVLVKLTEDGIKFHLGKLKKAKKLRRVGPDKGGRWEVLS